MYRVTDTGPLDGTFANGWMDENGTSREIVDGQALMSFATNDPVTVRRVELVSLDGGLELVDVRFAGGREVNQWLGSVGEWPPGPEFGTEIRSVGEQMPPQPATGSQETWLLLAKLRVTGDGRLVAAGYDVTYEVGGRTFTQRLPVSVVVCTPAHSGTCEQHMLEPPSG